MGGTWLPKKVIQRRLLAGQGFCTNSQPASPDFHPFWVIFSAILSGFQPKTPLKGWNWARNGFSTLNLNLNLNLTRAEAVARVVVRHTYDANDCLTLTGTPSHM